jgi:hypothetical protein
MSLPPPWDSGDIDDDNLVSDIPSTSEICCIGYNVDQVVYPGNYLSCRESTENRVQSCRDRESDKKCC